MFLLPMIQQSPDYPTFGYPTFRFIRRAVSERSILSHHVAEWITLPHHAPSTFYVRSGAGVTLRKEEEGGSETNTHS
jgi:hypothetical protein